MPYKIIKYESTPNPNALKCVLDRAIVASADSTGSHPSARSFRTPEQAQHDPLAAKLFAIEGVSSVLFGEAQGTQNGADGRGGWLTVNKEPEAGWKTIKSQLEQVLAQAS